LLNFKGILVDGSIKDEIENVTEKTIDFINKNRNEWGFHLNKLTVKSCDSNELIRASKDYFAFLVFYSFYKTSNI